MHGCSRTNREALQRKSSSGGSISPDKDGCAIRGSAPEETAPPERRRALFFFMSARLAMMEVSYCPFLTTRSNTCGARRAGDRLRAFAAFSKINPPPQQALARPSAALHQLLAFYRAVAPHLCRSVFSHLNVPPTQPSTPTPPLPSPLCLPYPPPASICCSPNGRFH